MKNKQNFIDSLVFLAIGIWIFIDSFQYHFFDWFLSPALFPILTSIALIVLSLSLLLSSFSVRVKKQEVVVSNPPVAIGRKNALKIGILMGMSFLYTYLLPILHFFWASGLYLFFFMFLLGERKWWLLLLVSFGTTAVLLYVFGSVFNVLMP